VAEGGGWVGGASIFDTVRLTEFQELLHTEFGVARGDALLTDHTIPELGGLTGAAAIDTGVDPRDVWRALCADFDVPRSRW
jgi:hypothetical protein